MCHFTCQKKVSCEDSTYFLQYAVFVKDFYCILFLKAATCIFSSDMLGKPNRRKGSSNRELSVFNGKDDLKTKLNR